MFKRPIPAAVSVVATAAAGSLAFYALDPRSAVHEYVFCPLLRTFTNAETSHRVAVRLLKYGLVPSLSAADRERTLKMSGLLGIDVFGKRLDHPIGLAAGMDKNGEGVDGLFGLGFLYVEVGLVTPEPQPGNPQPRFFRLPRDRAVINRYGFNSEGHFAVLANLRRREARRLNESLNESKSLGSGVLAVNLGKNKTGDEVEDYVTGVRRFANHADVLVVNVLLPNTPGLRDLQNEAKLTNLLKKVVDERNYAAHKPPLMVKVAPDLTEPEIASVAAAAKAAKVDGIIMSNTTVQRPAMISDPAVQKETGGLSGPPLKLLLLKALKTLRKHTRDSDLVLVGCGGISSAEDILEFGKAGASFVQLYTAFAYKGPGLPVSLRDDLARLLLKEGKTWLEVVASS